MTHRPNDTQAWAHSALEKGIGRALLSRASLESLGGREKEDAGRKMGSRRESPCPIVHCYLHCLCPCCQTHHLLWGWGEKILYVCGIETVCGRMNMARGVYTQLG